jgi:hypothetical protein
LTELHAVTTLHETSMRPELTSVPTVGVSDVATRGLIVILLGILPR